MTHHQEDGWLRRAWLGLTSPRRIHCAEFRELLDDYLDGELETDKTLHLDAHRSVCTRCSYRWHREKSWIDALRRKVKVAPRVGFAEALAEKLQAQSPR